MTKMTKMEDLLNTVKIKDMMGKQVKEDKKKNALVWVMAIIGVVTAIAAIIYAVYRFMTPEYLEDFEDDFDDDFDDNFFEDDEEIDITPLRKTANAVKEKAEDIKDATVETAKDIAEDIKDGAENINAAFNN